MAAQWLRTDRSIGGLAALLTDTTFWPKLILYIFHYLALIFGAVGIVLTLRDWRKFVPLSGFIVYTLLLHLFLLVVPRYLFPMMPFMWVFAAVAMVRLWVWVRSRKFALHYSPQPIASSPVTSPNSEPGNQSAG